MRRLFLYVVLLLAACVPTVIAARAMPSEPASNSHGAATR
jgi:hypothetical protein